MLELTDSSVAILLVDDREDGLLALEALLGNDKHYLLVKAKSGQEAIRAMDGHEFAMILMDVQMPGLDGFQTVERIRQNPRHALVPVVFVTAINKDDRYVYRGYEAGAVDYIFKPFDPVILKSKVAVFAELYLQRRTIRQQAAELAQQEAAQHRAQLQTLEFENLRRYQNLAEAIPHVLIRYSVPGLLDYHNHLWSEYTGLSTADTVGENWQKALCADDLVELFRVWAESLLTRKSFEAECRLRRHDGVFLWHWIKAVPEFDESRCVTHWLMTCTDIHARKLAEQNLKEAQKLAQAANDAKTHFLANMSHEIRTPLSAIMGFTELLLDPQISMEEKMKGAAIILRSGNALMRTVDEILDISKVEAGRLEIEKVQTNIIDLLNEIRSLMEISASKKNIELEFALCARIPQLIVTDSNRLRQILNNVIGNALKFTEVGKVTISSNFISREKGVGTLQFLVSDSGLGIAADQLEKIFQPFSQADSSTTRLYGGTGLGLPLARRLARALGGDVHIVKSAPGVGTTFQIDIRVDAPGKADWPEEVIDLDVREHSRRSVNSMSLQGRRVLLVEDAEEIQILIQQYLSRTGIHVELAVNGKEGVKKALADNFDVVLMDIQMPLVDGYQATRQLREAGYSRPIIAMTAHAMREEREKSLRTGCNGHLTKPINRQALIDSLIDAFE
jgi:PAS domain S-box-containing protein